MQAAAARGQIGPLLVLLKLLEGSHDVEPFLFKGFRILFVLGGVSGVSHRAGVNTLLNRAR